MAVCRPAAPAARRTRSIISPCDWCVPCEKFSRKMSTPAAVRSPMAASVLVAGPIVAMILVFRMCTPAYNDGVTVKVWLDSAIADAERRGMPALKPLLESLGRATAVLRAAEWNGNASGALEFVPEPDAR